MPDITLPPLPSIGVPPVDDLLTLTQATLQCTLDGLNDLLEPGKFQQCIDDYMNPSRTGLSELADRAASAAQ